MLTVRIPDDLRDRIDAQRPATTSREAWVRGACERALEAALGGQQDQQSVATTTDPRPSVAPASPRAHGSPSPSLERFG